MDNIATKKNCVEVDRYDDNEIGCITNLWECSMYDVQWSNSFWFKVQLILSLNVTLGVVVCKCWNWTLENLKLPLKVRCTGKRGFLGQFTHHVLCWVLNKSHEQLRLIWDLVQVPNLMTDIQQSRHIMICKLTHVALCVPKSPGSRNSILGSQLSLPSQYFILVCTTIYL